MGLLETKVRREPWDVEPRLTELGLDRRKLLHVAALARHDATNATPFHAANAAGTYAYHTGTWALRDAFVGQNGWSVDRTNGIEAIYNVPRRVRVIYSNVDVSCGEVQHPKPRSEKGAGAERVCSGNLFGDLPAFTREQASTELTFYLMVDERGVVELTRPLVRNGTFAEYYERLYLYQEDDDGPGGQKSLDDDDAINNFDPQVARKN